MGLHACVTVALRLYCEAKRLLSQRGKSAFLSKWGLLIYMPPPPISMHTYLKYRVIVKVELARLPGDISEGPLFLRPTDFFLSVGHL